MHGREARRRLLICAAVFTVASVATVANWSFGGSWPHPLWMYLFWIGMGVCWLGYFLMVAAGIVTAGFHQALDRHRMLSEGDSPKPRAAVPSPGRGLRVIKGGLTAIVGLTAGATTWVKNHPIASAAAVIGVVTVLVLPSGDPESDWIAAPPPPDGEITAPPPERTRSDVPEPSSSPAEPSATPAAPTTTSAPDPLGEVQQRVSPVADTAPTATRDAGDDASERPRPPAEPPRDDAPAPPTTSPRPEPSPTPGPPAEGQPDDPAPRQDRCFVEIHLGQLLHICIG